MYRFVALYWSDLSESARDNGARLERRLRALHPDWREVLSVDGLRIFDIGNRPGGFDAHLVAREGYRFAEGVVLGQVFAGLRSPQLFDGPPAFRGAQADALVSSGGASLIDTGFGRYVAFVLDRPRRRLHVVRSPQGELPCYVAQLGEASVFFSYFEDVRELASQGFSIDWDEVANFIAFQRTRPGRSGLREVAEIRAGFRRTESPRQTEWLRLWDPAKVAADAPFVAPGEAADAMREAVMRTVAAYASRYERVFHNLSGGLDSSVVAACLGKAPKIPAITCLNYYSDDPEGDERRYARLAAAHAGLPLQEARIDGREIDLRRMLQVVKGATPENYLYERPFKYFDARWMEDQAPQACFFGSGGDNVFFQPHTPFGAYDYLRLHGLGPDFLRVCFEAARLTRTDVLSVVRLAALARFESRPPALQVLSSETSPLVSAAVFRARDAVAVFELDAKSKTPAGKTLHISVATAVPIYYEPRTAEEPPMERIMPLFAQPVVEACLRAPTWLLTVGGRDRGLARRAFASILPPEIAGRESKGGADNLFGRTLAAHRGWIEPMLLDGLLADQGLIDRDAVRDALAAVGEGVSANQVGLLFLLCGEAWARDMAAPSLRAAAPTGK